MFSSLRGLGRLRWIVLGGVLLLVAAGAAAAVVLTSEPGDVSNPDVEFTRGAAAPHRAARPTRKDGAHPFDDGFSWPIYGYTKQRTRWLPLNVDLRPPFVQEWAVDGQGPDGVHAGAVRALGCSCSRTTARSMPCRA